VTVRIGALVPSAGTYPRDIGISAMAHMLEVAGFESLWVSDHVVMPRVIGSRYPFAEDGKATWPTSTPFFDALVALALVAAGTERVTLGTAVLVLPLRNPVIVAKQVSSIDVASRGRIRLGLGAGWLAEEFAALGVPFAARGRRLVDGIGVLRECWTGSYRGDIVCEPTPVHDVPIYVGGHSPTAISRAGALGEGWLGQQSLNGIDVRELLALRAAMVTHAREVGRDPERLEVILRIVDSAGRSEEIARALPALERAGVDEVIVDVDWNEGDPARDYARMAGG
jgi:probable F420-dependent oxidoreductase